MDGRNEVSASSDVLQEGGVRLYPAFETPRLRRGTSSRVFPSTSTKDQGKLKRESGVEKATRRRIVGQSISITRYQPLPHQTRTFSQTLLPAASFASCEVFSCASLRRLNTACGCQEGFDHMLRPGLGDGWSRSADGLVLYCGGLTWCYHILATADVLGASGEEGWAGDALIAVFERIYSSAWCTYVRKIWPLWSYGAGEIRVCVAVAVDDVIDLNFGARIHGGRACY
ncbi:hypothetical protein DACRYDRAFT_21733 [Dacryopinax primogenitus]|uniref:Uncharacterized protein n=1 Tax=Dacryopinax primogenitus (strain DJM 731) TaxID=1858805 RepID=M5FXL8_DACPD|nr:uncharacterized protein DACRYDRAFT_21733 [Dacryopinax primogenitus]EJU02766.1 hypothetical protein DACRYDRAFT_21733 [Dacryopinax primogenitus]